MKKVVKKVARKIAPNLASKLSKIASLPNQINDIKMNLDKLCEYGDFRLNTLKNMLKRVEPYQPTYGLTGLIESPSRDSLDRCRSIEQYLSGQISGRRFLDIGSSLGYVCFYFADRGAKSEGWEMNAENAEASRLISQINGIPVDIKTKKLDESTVQTIQENEYDAVFILSVMHHVIHHQGLKTAQKLMEEIVSKVPVIFVELAKKGEDKKLFWDSTQPIDELAIFDLVKDDVNIKKIGDFSNHLSDHTRPLYVIERKKVVKVNNKDYLYNTESSQAYEYSEAALYKERRHYYWSDRYLIKEYIFENGNTADNAALIINEIAYLLRVRDIKSIPKIVDYEINNKGAKIVFDLIKGDIISTHRLYSEKELKTIYNDIAATLGELHSRGIYHNDVRSWNIMYDGEHAYLIDIAQASGVDEDHDMIALMWLMSALYKGARESTKMAKTNLPDISEMPNFLKEEYKKIDLDKARSKG